MEDNIYQDYLPSIFDYCMTKMLFDPGVRKNKKQAKLFCI